jgi:hypothetical protein
MFSAVTMAVVVGLAFTFSAPKASASMSYECWTYVNGSPDKMVTVSADNKSQAEALARAKFDDLGRRYDYVSCK